MADIWPVVHAEREALSGDLEGLGQDRWDTTTLCNQWSVRDVVAHMTATATITPATFFPKLVASGFSLSRLQAKDIVIQRGSSPGDTLDRFKAATPSVKGPPGPKATMLGETIVHAEDVRRPLGITHTYPMEAVVEVADFYKGSNLIIGTKRRIAGLGLQATDTEWSHGSGPLVSGPMLDVLMAMTGRKEALVGLSGDGVEVLRGR
jgi:uncharacterized protein (TIGR03083 family)